MHCFFCAESYLGITPSIYLLPWTSIIVCIIFPLLQDGSNRSWVCRIPFYELVWNQQQRRQLDHDRHNGRDAPNLRQFAVLVCNNHIHPKIQIGTKENTRWSYHIFMFFLCPIDFSIWILFHFWNNFIIWEWSNLKKSWYISWKEHVTSINYLFKTSDCDAIIKTSCSSFFDQIVINFTRTENNSLDISWVLCWCSFFWNHSLERCSFGHFWPFWSSFWQTKKRFWCQ